MNNCLVSKLRETVNNDSLNKLGELKIYFDEVESPTAIGQGFMLRSSPDSSLYVSNGHLTSSSLSDDLGTEATINDIATLRYVSNSIGGAIVNVKDKYNLKVISLRGGALNLSNRNQVNHIHLNIEDIEFCQIEQLLASHTSCIGDIGKAFHRNDNLLYVELDYTNVTGDVSVFENQTSLIRLHLDETSVSGDMTKVMCLPALQQLRVANCIGDTSTITQSNSLKVLYMKNCGVTGLIEDFFSHLNALTTVESYNSSKLTGSIENIILPSTCSKFLFRSNLNITGSKAAFQANNPNCTTVDFQGCTNVTA